MTKIPAPLVVRGDGAGGTVTYTFEVTNPGNTPLIVTDGDDSNCESVDFIGGDANGDQRLDTTETWTYECTRVLKEGLTQEDIFVDNTAEVHGVDPEGTQVDAEADATVQVLVPFINLEKDVVDPPTDPPVVAPGTPVTYEFTVTNLGNDPLTDITLTDDRCTPTFVDDGGGNGDDVLDLTETWTYTCTAVVINDPTINQATVTGTPSIGPDVDDPASAEVDVLFTDLNLNKVVDPNVVFSGDTVTYTYTLSVPATAVDPVQPPEGQTPADVVTDPDCAPVCGRGRRR